MVRTLSTALFTVFMLLISTVAFAASAAPEAPKTVELAPGVYAFIGVNGGTNSGFVVTDEGVVVVDSQGPRELALAFKKAIAEKTDRPVLYVINTHYHGDHTFGNQYIAPSKAAIIAHEETRRAMIERDHAHRTRFKKFFGEESLIGFNATPPGLTFTDRLTIRAGGRTIDLIHPGTAHTFGDAYVVVRDTGVVFTGDLAYNRRLPLLGEGDTTGAVAAIDDLVATGARTFVPGHGKVATAEDLVEYRRYLLALISEVRRLGAGGATRDEVASTIRLPEFSGWIKYDDWKGQNAGAVYDELFGAPGHGEATSK